MIRHGALPMLLTAVRFRSPFGAGFSEKYHVSPLSILGHCFDVGQGTQPLNGSLDLGLNEYLVGQGCNVYDKFNH